jgi:hypothetical protein
LQNRSSALDERSFAALASPRAALGRQLDLYDIRQFDAPLGASLEKLAAAASSHGRRGGRAQLLIDGVPVEDLCLTFVLPGYPDYELRPGGSEVCLHDPLQHTCRLRLLNPTGNGYAILPSVMHACTPALLAVVLWSVRSRCPPVTIA